MRVSKGLRSTDAASGVGGDCREGKLADGRGGAKIGGEPGRPDSAAAGANGEQIKVVLLSGVGAVGLAGSDDGRGAAVLEMERSRAAAGSDGG